MNKPRLPFPTSGGEYVHDRQGIRPTDAPQPETDQSDSKPAPRPARKRKTKE